MKKIIFYLNIFYSWNIKNFMIIIKLFFELHKKKKEIIFILLTINAFQICLTSCTSAWIKYNQKAEELRFIRNVISLYNFNIVIYKNQSSYAGKRLHIYLDGDGSPWRRGGTVINEDPTPRQYLVLQLMSLDSSPAILIGRPCYHGLNRDIHCHPLLWTHERYSEKVVSAISESLEIILKNNNISQVVLIGYSGGGTLAQLLAERIKQTCAVLTLAGNLDTAAWTQLHGYAALQGSMNPAQRSPLSKHILQLHYVGGSDQNIPSFLVKKYISGKDRGEMRILEEVDHYNGWLAHWTDILDDLNRKLENKDTLCVSEL
jgi:hypothetical protein